jgi:DNA repair protein RecO (recombination protein O)
MIHSTKGIVLRTIKYGETSIIVSIYTAMFGLQSYLVNGVRISTKKGPARANLFQPAAILDLVVYHNELKNLQRLKEFKWGYLYQHLFFSVRKNAVALFMVELLQKCLKQPEGNQDLFHFLEDAFIHLDQSNDQVMANYPLFFSVHLASVLGLGVLDDYSPERPFLDLQEGVFVKEQPQQPYFLADPYSYITSQLLKVAQPHELEQIGLNQEARRVLLQAYQTFYTLHIQDFSPMKTLPVLQAVL